MMSDHRTARAGKARRSADSNRRSVYRLTTKQQWFVAEYLLDLNATQAAIRAGYSRRSASKIGPQLLEKTGVSAAIHARQKVLQEKLGIRQEQVLAALAAIAFADMTDYVESDGVVCRLRPLSALSHAQRMAIAHAKQHGHGFTLRLHSKVRALDMLARHLGLYRDE
jgi:phage terminase small subunit